jgi:site-specific DNA recombinase
MERIVERVDSYIPAQPRALRVCAYARVSSGKDAMLHSLSAQVSHYSEMIQSHIGWVYCGVYSDEALTGTKSDREGFQQMLTDCRAGKIDMVITKSISRFARNTVTLLQTVRELKSMGIDVYFEEQYIHTISADGELMMTILASYAQEESLSASENQKWRVRKAFENGELINLRFLFGYSITADGVQINEKEAAIVREIFSRFNGGESMSSISRDLNARGYRGALGGKWCAERMRNTLSNEKYLGNALLQKRYRNNHIEKKLVANKGELPMYYAEGTHEPIIDQATFDKAQERLRMLAQQTANRKKPTRSAFSGLIHCGLCGNTYKRVTYRKKHYWNCTTFQTKGKSECAAKRIPEETLEVLTCEVLGEGSIDSDMVRSKITAIRADKNNVVVYCMDDGSEIAKRWKDRSRAESWTPEMKEKARQRALQARRKKE